MFNTLQKHNTMKRLFTIGLMLVSAFALTNCAEEIAAPVQDDITVDGNIENNTPPEEEVNIPFEVFATVGGEADTKTVNWGNATYWKDKDQISVFHGTGENYTHNSIFELIDASTGKFAGALKNTLNEKNDWYFLYPYSSSATTLTVSGVQIGAQTINQTLISDIDENIVLSANSKAHICGNLSPMLGRITNLPRNEQPEIEMKHLAAIVAIKVVNDGFGGDIMIKDVEFAVPDVYKTDNNGKIETDGNGNPIKLQNAFPIVGQFQVNMSNGQCTAIADNSYASTKFELPSAVSLKKGDALTFYLPVMPFSATKTISIKVNSSERAISKAVKLESGKVTTFSVPVKTLEAKDVHVENGIIMSDAFTITSIGRTTTDDSSHTTGNANDIVITTSVQPETIKVNGQDVQAYVLGAPKDKNGKYTTGTITITGFFKDLINALPVKFYVSTWNDTPAVMKVNKVTAWIPVYSTKETQTSKESIDWNSTRYKYSVETDFSTLSKRAGAKGELASVAMGSKVAKIESWMLEAMGSAEKLSFSNISQNGNFENDNIIVLNEGFTQKEINDGNIDKFLAPFKNAATGNQATVAGLRKLANAELKDLPLVVKYIKQRKSTWALITLWSTESITLDASTPWPPKDEKGKSILDPEIEATIDGMYARVKQINIADLVNAVDEIPTQYDMIHMLRDTKVSIELTTTKDGPCIVFWGLDADTTKDKADRGETAE